MGLPVTKFQEMDRRVIWRQVVRTVDAAGGVVETPTDITVWAGRDFRGGDGGSEMLDKSGVISANADVIWFMRTRAVKLEDKIIYKGVTYDIERIEEDGRNNYIRIYCNADKTS